MNTVIVLYLQMFQYVKQLFLLFLSVSTIKILNFSNLFLPILELKSINIYFLLILLNLLY